MAEESVISTVIYKKANPKTDKIALFPLLRKQKGRITGLSRRDYA
ncbi:MULTISPECIES: hypothetical protein [Enterobacter cloacae complex]|nr:MULTISPECIES: hypothetical protein [Enterobacter cloacae complex]WFC91288.1 hypothetical protein OM420_00865 [Enterobacter roggenkampii]